MRIAYLITANNNPLYEGNFQINGKYLSFGQHSFIYDLVLAIKSSNIDIEFYIDGLDVFPLNTILANLNIPIYELTGNSRIDTDIILFDTVADNLLVGNYRGYKIGVIHNYMNKHSELFYSECDAIICMTPYAIEKQNIFYSSNKYHLIRQGVYCNRFSPSPKSYNSRIESALFYSRMDRYKGYAYNDIIKKIIDLGIDVSILGAGEMFDFFKAYYYGKINCLDHIPCHEIHKVINKFDLIVSNGRGVMEGMSANKPTIAVGLRYSGLITRDNILEHRDRNFTGAYMPDKPLNIEHDLSLIHSCYKYDELYFSNLARTYLNVNDFLDNLIKLKDNVYI